MAFWVHKIQVFLFFGISVESMFKYSWDVAWISRIFIYLLYGSVIKSLDRFLTITLYTKMFYFWDNYVLSFTMAN